MAVANVMTALQVRNLCYCLYENAAQYQFLVWRQNGR